LTNVGRNLYEYFFIDLVEIVYLWIYKLKLVEVIFLFFLSDVY